MVETTVDIATGSSVPNINYTPDPPVQYVKLITALPEVTAPAVSLATLPKMRQSFLLKAQAVNRPAITADEAKIYLRLFMNGMQERLEAQWKSLGFVIGNVGDTITPNTLLAYKDDNNATVEVPETECPIANYDIALIAMLIYPYRVKNYTLVTHATYKTALATKLSIPLAHFFGNQAYNIAAFEQSAKYYTGNRSFIKMVAALDMFLNKFQTRDESAVRCVTLASRSRECTALSDLIRTSKLLNMKPNVLAQWMWSSELYDDYKRLSEPNCELDDPNGFMHYITELGLTGKNPYSAQSNSHMHMYLNVIGLIHGKLRSKNAIALDTVNQITIRNAEIVGYITFIRGELDLHAVDSNRIQEAKQLKEKYANMRLSGHTTEPGREEAQGEDGDQTVDRGQDSDDEDDNGGDGESVAGMTDLEDGLDGLPDGTDPLHWFDYFAGRSGELPPVIRNALNRLYQQNASPRPGSIAEFMRGRLMVRE